MISCKFYGDGIDRFVKLWLQFPIFLYHSFTQAPCKENKNVSWNLHELSCFLPAYNISPCVCLLFKIREKPIYKLKSLEAKFRTSWSLLGADLKGQNCAMLKACPFCIIKINESNQILPPWDTVILCRKKHTCLYLILLFFTLD